MGLQIVFGVEGATRVFGIHFPSISRRTSSDRDLWTYDGPKGWFHVPGGSGVLYVSRPDRATVRVNINALGFRGGEISRQKTPGVKRVLVLGDSFVFGLGVDEENLFTSHLGRLLDRYPGGPYEVVNMGVSGYSTDQELILLEELGLRLAPDLVVLVVCDNDFQGNLEDFAYRRYYKPYFELDPGGGLALRNRPVPTLSRAQQAKLFLAQESNVWNFVRSRNTDYGAFAPVIGFFQVGSPRASTVDPLEVTTALILATADRVDAAGARFLTINTGHRGERTPLFHALRPRLAARGIHQFGLEEILGNARRREPERYWDFPDDTHWNRDAHHLAAEAVFTHIRTKGLLQREESEG